MIPEYIPLLSEEMLLPIKGYEGLYSITNFGRVWSHKRFIYNRYYGGYFLKLQHNRRGYIQVNIRRNGGVKNVRVHVLVAQHYIPNPNNLPEVNHKDGDKLNCREDNLEWSTGRSNVNHALINNLFKRKYSHYFGVTYNKGYKQRKKPWVAWVMSNGIKKHTGYYETEIEAAKAYNVYVIEHKLDRLLNRILFI